MRINSGPTPDELAEQWSYRHESRVLNLEDIFVELSRN